MFPLQGDWTEEQYLALERSSGNWMMELADGCLEVLPMPDTRHQRIVKYTFRQLDDFAEEADAGEVLCAPYPIRLWARQLREPDIVVVKPFRLKDERTPPRGADLVVEVVSPGKENRERDLEIKPREYARARIPEYWIIDPEEETITVLTLAGKAYKVHGVFQPGEHATSKVLTGFTLDVSAVFAAGAGKRS